MSYIAGMSPSVASLLGGTPGSPRFECDQCHTTFEIGCFPPKWFLAGKPPRGWKQLGREHMCGRCKVKP